MAAIALPPGNLSNLQKVNDVRDWFDPEIDTITREHLKVVPGGGGRAWEFSIIFLALLRAGKLHPKSRGLAMGAGRERLIYTIAPHVEEVVVTDLYKLDSRWSSVHTDDPQSFVMSRLPWPIDEGRIKALPMDMRELDFPDNSFDFAWSTGAFEHIGEDADFARHFKEVHRVLKPGGVYAFTTAVVFADSSARLPNNYYFSPRHLIELADASPLHPEPVFDCTIEDNHLNRPVFNMFQDFGLEAVNNLIHSPVIWRRGILGTANSLILTKDDSRPKTPTRLAGFEETKARLESEARSLTRSLWREPHELKLEIRDQKATTPKYHFGSGPVTLTVKGPAGTGPIQLVTKKRRAIPPFEPTQAKTAMSFSSETSGAESRLEADSDYLYDFVLLGDPSLLPSLRLTAQRA